MQKTTFKRILGLFILGIIFTFISFPVVNAETKCEDIDWANRYNIDLDYDGENFIFTMDLSKNIADEIKNYYSNGENVPIMFRIYEVTAYTSNQRTINLRKNNYILGEKRAEAWGATEEVRIKSNDLIEKMGLNRDDYIILEFLLSTNSPYNDPGGCQNIKIELVIEYSNSSSNMNEVESNVGIQETITSAKKINCNPNQTTYTSSFEDQFCEAKNKSSGNHFDFSKTNNLYSDNDSETFKCDFNVDTKENKTYYVNKGYRYGYGTKEVNSRTYHYNYENGKTAETEKASCSVQCEEAVTVEYGPPVASKAGLCFEYKVKVTSRISCAETASEVKKPKTLKYCTPVPSCKYGKSKGEDKQGGPNSEFDSCVVSCDGGKYTEKCSEKCYNEVYNSSITKTSGTELSYVLKLADASKGSTDNLNNCERLGKNHYCYNDGMIYWNWNGTLKAGIRYNSERKNNNGCLPNNHYKNGNGSFYSCETDSTWHQTHEWGYKGNYTNYSDTGIPRTATCKETCTWKGCTQDNYYLNYDTAKKDMEANYKAYNELVTLCKAAASCNTTTAEFTISVDYTKRSSSTVTNISFPYNKKGNKEVDKLTSLGSGSSKVNTSNNRNTTILTYHGCYEKDDQKEADTKWYQAEWSFPGTWINNKNGWISYAAESSSAWSGYPKKFCIPSDAKDVNQKWWNNYYTTKYSKESSYALNDKDLLSKSVDIGDCSSTIKSCTYSTTSFTDKDAINIDYNIHAFAKDFGYFNWNINIDCFYALNSDNTDEPICEEFKKSNKKACKNSDDFTDGYVVRSVDLKNLFPGEDGAKVSPDKTGRTPGFNWTSHANQEIKDSDYQSTPEEYIKWIQTKAYSVYSKDYIDYEVKLTKDVIKELKDNSREYTNFEGTVDVKSNSAIHYRSPLFSSNGVLSDSIYPNGDALKCNNIGKHSLTSGYSAECQTY